jgi:methionyl aminopeptidase
MILKSKEEIALMREGGKILAQIMKEVKQKVYPGVTTLFLNECAEKLIKESGGKASFKGYKGFPFALCTSVNEVIVHGVPSEYKLKEGDILSLDIGIFYKGFHTDMAITVPVGKINGEAVRIIRETKKALKRGIKKVREGNTFGDIGNTIERHIGKTEFSIVRGLCGHGIGRELHEEPQVFNEGKRRKGMPLEKGLVFCIEPMVSMGSVEIKTSSDKMGVETADGSLSAHFEHTVALTEKGAVVLTEI